VVVTVVMISVITSAMMFVMVIVATFITFAMMLTISWSIDIVVPSILNKIDRAAASVISAAVIAPPFLMSWWYTQINRLIYHPNWTMDDDRFGIYQFWLRVIADINLAIEPRLTDAD
jgi:hypothetical protein